MHNCMAEVLHPDLGMEYLKLIAVQLESDYYLAYIIYNRCLKWSAKLTSTNIPPPKIDAEQSLCCQLGISDSNQLTVVDNNFERPRR